MHHRTRTRLTRAAQRTTCCALSLACATFGWAGVPAAYAQELASTQASLDAAATSLDDATLEQLIAGETVTIATDDTSDATTGDATTGDTENSSEAAGETADSESESETVAATSANPNALAAALNAKTAVTPASELASPGNGELEGEGDGEAGDQDPAQATAFTLTTTVNGTPYQAFVAVGATQETGSPAASNYYLYLPAGTQTSALTFTYTGNVTTVEGATLDTETSTITGLLGSTITLTVASEENPTVTQTVQVTVAVSNLAAMSLTLNGTTLEEVHAGPKTIKYQGNTLQVLDATGAQTLLDTAVELKGRGNSTWTFEKRPYQIKLSSKQNLFGMGSSKTWVLLANHRDVSLLRNNLSLGLATAIGMDYTSQATNVDLWIGGEYLGTYALCEKVQLGSNRVEISSENAILAEVDYVYYQQEDTWFVSSISNAPFVLKDSNAATTAGELAAFAAFQDQVTAFETALYETRDWDAIEASIDVQSFVNYYLVKEYAADWDALKSSLFLYTNGDGDVLHMGPVWDFDLCYGNFSDITSDTSRDQLINPFSGSDSQLYWFVELWKFPQFRTAVVDTYQNIFAPAAKSQLATVDAQAAALATSAAANFARWNLLGQTVVGASGTYAPTYLGEVETLKTWMAARLAYMDTRYTSAVDYETLITYDAHVENVGWQRDITGGETAGTVGSGLRMEAVSIKTNLEGTGLTGGVRYRAHVENIGWQGWTEATDAATSSSSSDPTSFAGTSGQGLRVEALQLELTGELAQTCKLVYRVHVENLGWLGWATSGETAGTQGQGLRIEAIQIKVVPNSQTVDRSSSAFVGYMTAQAHVENLGWLTGLNESSLLGSQGMGLRMESLQLTLNREALGLDPTTSKTVTGDIYYRAHVQNYGWQRWASTEDPTSYAGTQGEGLRMEAIELRLSGRLAELYTLEYRAHVENIGWQDWITASTFTVDDKYFVTEPTTFAGTQGEGLRVEAIELRLVRK